MNRLVLVLVIALAGTLLLSAVALQQYRGRMLEDYQRAVRSLVDVAHGVVAHHHELERSGALSRADAQAAAIAALRALRYDGVEYFWINDSGPVIVMHPIKPELEGKNLGQSQDPNGKYLFREFARVANAEGAGFVDYMWPKPGSEAPQPKLSYVKMFKPWDWIVGSGIYVDDIGHAFMGHLYQFAAVVAGFSHELSGVSRSVAEAAHNQSGAASSIAAAVEQMTVSVTHISDSARETETNSERAATLARQGAAGSLREIREGTQVALGRIREVADAAKEQSSVSTSIAQQVEQIAKMVEGTSSSMRSAVSAVEELEKLSADLHELVGRFRY